MPPAGSWSPPIAQRHPRGPKVTLATARFRTIVNRLSSASACPTENPQVRAATAFPHRQVGIPRHTAAHLLRWPWSARRGGRQIHLSIQKVQSPFGYHLNARRTTIGTDGSWGLSVMRRPKGELVLAVRAQIAALKNHASNLEESP
jgi:hypothetical protein